MEPNQAFFDSLKPGQIYNAHGEIVVIIDVLRSQFTGNIALYVRFIRNIGNARQYDILELTPEKHLGVIEWELTTTEELTRATMRRAARLAKELADIEKFAQDN